jgi:hypothetical protein
MTYITKTPSQEVLLRGELGKIGENAVVWDEGIGKVSNCPDIF